MQLRRMTLAEPPTGAHLIYLAREVHPSAAWLEQAQRASVLLVSDDPRGLSGAIAMNFIETGERVRFEISVPAATLANLKLSSRLLAVAERILPAP